MRVDNLTADEAALLVHLVAPDGPLEAPSHIGGGLDWPPSMDGRVSAVLATEWRDEMVSSHASSLAAYAAAKRRAVIGAGCVVTVAGVDVPCWADADTQAALTALVVASQMQPALSAPWRGRDGLTYALDVGDIVVLAMGVLSFVNTAFGANAQIDAAIDAGTITTTAAIDAAAWPPNDAPMPSP